MLEILEHTASYHTSVINKFTSKGACHWKHITNSEDSDLIAIYRTV